MKWIRRKYIEIISITKYHSALIIQKHLKGYKVYKVWKNLIHRYKIDKILNHFKNLKLQLYTDSQIKIRFAWKIYKRMKVKI